MDFRKTPFEAEIIDLLRKGQVELPPLRFSMEPHTQLRDANQPDGFAQTEWKGRRHRFVVEVKRLWTPKAISEGIAQALRYARPPEFHPLLVVPYLSEEGLAELESAGVSGVDLCGNGVVMVPGELLVQRTGRANRFRSESEIKNVFRGNSSLVSRALLIVPEFRSVQHAADFIRERGGSISLPTVSKVCKNLESHLVLERTRSASGPERRLRLLQPDRLLDLLVQNFTLPVVSRIVRGKARRPLGEIHERLAAMKPSVARVVRTGFGSLHSYAVMAAEPEQPFYTTNLDETLAALGDAFAPAERFADLAFHETDDLTVYFDPRPGLVASPVQAYLELATGDKRSRETAGQVRRAILEPLLTAMISDR
ncbi:hypothetical protein [Aquisphaera insulae]|uniref:hypothetical protein n=1 Tax=Aquisphaera insulae TaxID=2712864 RepID=UPI0013E9AEFB|nr:hypothetical protein [Aquisphaera insulae]